MKKLILILIGIVLMTAITYGQRGASPISDLRVPHADTAFKINIPVGTKVFNVNLNKYYYCITATHGDSTLTNASVNFTEFGTYGETDPIWISDSATYASKSYVNARIHDSIETTKTWVENKNYLEDGDFTTNGVMVRTAAGTYTNRSVAGTANEVTVTNGDGVSGNPTISLVMNKDLVAGSGLTGGADNILIGADADVTLKADTTLLSTQYYVDSQGFLTSEVDGSITNEGLLTVGAGGANSSTINSNTSTSNAITVEGTTDHILITENTGTHTITIDIDDGIADNKVVTVDDADAADNDFAKFTAAGIEGRSYTETREDLGVRQITQTFEESSGTPTGHTLTGAPTGGEAGMLVTLNGTVLTTDQFELSGTTLTLQVTVYTYDKVSATYEY